MNQPCLFDVATVTRVRECPNCHRIILAGRRMCDVCASEHRQDSRRNYRMGLSLFEDEYETGYDAAQERWELAEFELVNPTEIFRAGARFPYEDLIEMRRSKQLPAMTQLRDVRTGNYTLLGLI